MRLIKKAEAHGKTVLFWGDVLLENNSEPLPREMLERTVPVIWGYEPDHPFDEQCARVVAALPENRKHEFLIAPGTASWLSFSGRRKNAEINISRACQAAKKYDASGILLAHWGDKGYFNAFKTAVPEIIFGGAVAWNTETTSDDDALSVAVKAYLRVPQPKRAPAEVAEILMAAGTIDGVFSKRIHNQSLLHTAFFAKPERLAELAKDVSAEELQQAATLLQTLLERLEKVWPKCRNVNDYDISRACETISDLRVALEFNGEAIQRLWNAKNGIPVTNAHDEKLKEMFKMNWERCYQVGGLDEALSYFDKRK